MKIDVLLFDLGGVLIELKGRPLPTGKAPVTDVIISGPVRQFERGEITTEEFANALKSQLEIEESIEAIIDHFTNWPAGFYPGAIELLSSLEANYRVAALTNTNELHWPRITHEFNAHNYLGRIFASHLIGMAKPDEAFFKHALEQLEVEASSVVYMDDIPRNVEVANKVGMNAFHTKGFDSVLEVIERINIQK
ncbi:HAD family hydrolase [Microbulbifer sp. SSSA008]|uniref:HAD family hydrolase n=1 Tax=Microbulbifer sp. SSSA008 TaxID=3243380 RepID=UPI004039A057